MWQNLLQDVVTRFSSFYSLIISTTFFLRQRATIFILTLDWSFYKLLTTSLIITLLLTSHPRPMSRWVSQTEIRKTLSQLEVLVKPLSDLDDYLHPDIASFHGGFHQDILGKISTLYTLTTIWKSTLAPLKWMRGRISANENYLQRQCQSVVNTIENIL